LQNPSVLQAKRNHELSESTLANTKGFMTNYAYHSIPQIDIKPKPRDAQEHTVSFYEQSQQLRRPPLYELNKQFKSSRIHHYLNKVRNIGGNIGVTEPYKSQDFIDLSKNMSSSLDRDINTAKDGGRKRRDSIESPVSADSNISKSVSSEGNSKKGDRLAKTGMDGTKFNSTMRGYMTAFGSMHKDEVNFNPKTKGTKKVYNESVKMYTQDII
jgi:hypothetical protein